METITHETPTIIQMTFLSGSQTPLYAADASRTAPRFRTPPHG
jgi:hypothetical protein